MRFEHAIVALGVIGLSGCGIVAEEREQAFQEQIEATCAGRGFAQNDIRYTNCRMELQQQHLAGLIAAADARSGHHRRRSHSSDDQTTLSAVGQGCPTGSFRSVDSAGNAACESIDSGRTVSIRGSIANCPIGTHPNIDSYGNRVCESLDNGQKFYDTSKGCPIGTFASVDSYGNRVCQKL